MAGALNKLTVVKVAGKLAPGRYGDGGGLYLDVDARGRRWIFRYRWKAAGTPGAGKRRELGLGPVRDVTLAQARVKAAAARDLLRAGRDPIEIRRTGITAAPTFGTLADAYIDRMAPQFKSEKHLAQWRMTLGDAYCKSLRGIPVDRVEVSHVLAVLTPVWSAKAETASRIRGRIERVLDSARVQGLRSGENPARWRGHLDHLLPRRHKLQRGHHTAMAIDDVPRFVARLRATPSRTAYALEFTILTAARTGEVVGARWEEIAIDVWIIPAARMKAQREHRVPLPRRALEILEITRGFGSDWCFPGTGFRKPLSNMAMLELVKPLGVTVHGFRSAFRDWAGDRTAFPPDLAEASLAHVVKDKTEAAYRRGDALERRRKLMEAWAEFCGSYHRPAVVVPLRRG